MDVLIQAVVFLTFAAVTLVPFLTSLGALPNDAKFLAEFLSGPVAVYVIIAGIRQRFGLVSAKYWLAFGGTALILVCGALANDVGSGPLISGMRYYLRAIPFFFLPAVYEFKDWQLRQQLRALGALCLLQVPVAVFQRHEIMVTGHTTNADAVIGTVMQSGVLSMLLICALCVFGAAMLRDRLPKWVFALLFLLFIFPMSINETKATVILLPLGLLTTFIVGAPAHKRVQATVGALAILAVGGAIFVPVFDYYQAKTAIPYKIADFFTNKTELYNYLNTGARVGTHKEAGRVEALTIPVQELARDPVTLALGLGLGNVSHSSLGTEFTGAHYGVYGRYTNETSIATFLFEAGILGTGLILWLHWLVLTDAFFVARTDPGVVGTLALGFVGTLAVVTVGLFYIALHITYLVSYLFWYLAGVIAARRMQLRSA